MEHLQLHGRQPERAAKNPIPFRGLGGGQRIEFKEGGITVNHSPPIEVEACKKQAWLTTLSHKYVDKEVKRFKRFDKVKYKNQVGIIYGLRSSGYFDIRTLSGEKIHSSVKWQNLKLLERAKTLILERRDRRIPLRLKEDGVSCAGL